MSNIHPLIEDGLNPEQLAAVMQMKNCVVAAGAGSGKTFVLARRFAHLVIDCDMSVDSILTLTFTKKAASEMYQRIYKTLKEIADSPQSEGLANERAQIAVANFHTARIQTIDSFCASIVRSASRFYGIRPDFAIDDKAVKEFAQTTARDFMLKHRTNDALQQLASMEKFEDNIDKIFANPILMHSNIAEPLNFSESIATQITQILEEWETQINLVFEDRAVFEEYKSNFIKVFETLEDAFPTKEDLANYFSVQQDASKDEESKQNSCDELQPQIKAFFTVLYAIKKQVIPRDEEGKALIKDPLLKIRDAYDALTGIGQYVLYFPEMLKIIPILEDFQSTCNEWKRSSGNLTFADVSSLALSILTEHPDIRKSEKNGISAIMIDEFQDNNEMQRDLLFLLAERPDRMETSVPAVAELCPEKLFFVGDEKQSIYLFRGADVSVFRNLKVDLSSDDLSLSINYRSCSQLLAAFNSLFGGYAYSGEKSAYREAFTAGLSPIANGNSIFIQKHQLLDPKKDFPLFEAEYSPLYANPVVDNADKTENPLDASAKIHFCLLDKTIIDAESKSSSTEDSGDDFTEDEDSKGDEENLVEAENLAIFTAEKITELCALGQNTKAVACYKPEDIAILFRSYSNQSLYEKHLRRCGIPYVSEIITGFFGDAPVNDIFSLIRLIVYPQDAASYGIVLRSPFVRLTHQETALCLLSLGIGKKIDSEAYGEIKSSVHSETESEVLFCEQGAEFLTEAGKTRYNDGLARYNRLRLAANTANCAEMISLLWYNEGYRYETMWDIDGALFAELYDYLFEIARMIDDEGGNLSHLAEYLSKLEGKNERLNDMDIPLERAPAVRLMGIHKSKGLEFPVIFLCGASSGGGREKLDDKVYVNSKWGTSLNFPLSPDIKDCTKNYFFQLASNIVTQKAAAELRRLLYVALTRAEKELYITASFSVNKAAQKLLDKPEKDAQKLLEKANKDAEKLLDKAKKDSQKLLDKANKAAQKLLDKPRKAADDILDKAKEAVDDLLDKAKETADELLNRVQEATLKNDTLDPSNETTETKLFTTLEAICSAKVTEMQKEITDTTLLCPDYCTPNNSFFAFLLPLIVQFKGQKAPFSLENIRSMTRSELQAFSHDTKKLSMHEAYEKVAPIFENAQVLETPEVKSPYRTPSKLDAAHNAAFDEITYAQNPAHIENRLPELDKIITSFKNGNFDYSHFGTIAHAFAEAAFTNQEPHLPPNAISALSAKQLKIICDLAKKMADNFVQSPLGQAAKVAKWRKNEYDFKLLLKPPANGSNPATDKIIVNGQIDLLYEDENNTLHIVDYKTDAIENPDIHILQLAAYRRAAALIRNKPLANVQCHLFYLRTGTAVDITAQTAQVDLEGAAFATNT